MSHGLFMEKGLALMLAARTHSFFVERHYMKRPCIEGDEKPPLITDIWDALAMLVRPFNEGTDHSVCKEHAIRNKHPFTIIQVYAPGSWRKQKYDFPIDDKVVEDLRHNGYVTEGTFYGHPYDKVLRLTERGEEALYDYLEEKAASATT